MAAMLWSASGIDRTGEGLEHVDELRPHRERDGSPGCLEPRGQSGGVVEEHLAFPDLDEHRGQTARDRANKGEANSERGPGPPGSTGPSGPARPW